MSFLNIPKGLIYCNMKRDNELNERLVQRNIPSKNLEPSFSPRPVPTKYTLFPTSLACKNYSVCYEKYNIYDTFNPGNAKAPWSGYASNVNEESILRNQINQLSKDDKNTFIPDSSGELYNVKVVSKPEIQPFPNLFQNQNFHSFNPNTLNIGKEIFNNCTRQQLYDKCK